MDIVLECVLACGADDNKHKKVIEIRLHNNEMTKKKENIIKYDVACITITINKILKFRHELAEKTSLHTYSPSTINMFNAVLWHAFLFPNKNIAIL